MTARPAPARFQFERGWRIGGDGIAQSARGGGDCRVILPAFSGPMPAGLELACRLRVAVRSSEPGLAFTISVACRGSLAREIVAFAEAEQQIDLVLPAWSAGDYRLELRVGPLDPASPGGRRATRASRRTAIAVLKVELAWRMADDRSKDMLVEAGLAAARSLFRPFAHEDDRAEAGRLADLVGQAIRSRSPFSIVRLGDGEGRLLAHPGPMTDADIEVETIWFTFGPAAVEELKSRYGSGGIDRGIATLQHLIHQAMRSADGLGLPRPVHFERYLSKPEDERHPLANAIAGYAGALIATARHLPAFAPGRLFDTYAFYAVHQMSLFGGLLSGLPYLGVVAHSDRSREIAGHFRIGRVEHFPIPGHHVYTPSAALHFPDRHIEIAAGLRVPFTGAPFLVAAGYLGKFYCDVIKSRGGIALDIGSVFDAWFGIGRTDAIGHTAMRLALA